MQIHFVDAGDDLCKLSFTQEGDALVLAFTPDAQTDVLDAFAAWAEGGEDFALVPDGKMNELGKRDIESGELWFWSSMRP